MDIKMRKYSLRRKETTNTVPYMGVDMMEFETDYYNEITYYYFGSNVKNNQCLICKEIILCWTDYS